jgi:hypothetical protein
MKKRTCMLLIACFGYAVALPADDAMPVKTHPDSSGWRSLFAADLSDAIFPKGVWSIQNGELTATEDQNIWTKKQYENFILDLEFKNSSGSNSGVFVYGSDLDDWISNSVEIQILDDSHPTWAKVPPTWRCGGIFGHLAPTRSAVKKAGEWNRMTITCKGSMIYVLLNGKAVAHMDMKKWNSATKNPDGSDIPSWYKKPLCAMATKGHIGLQGKHGGVPIFFRNIKIKTLSAQRPTT